MSDGTKAQDEAERIAHLEVVEHALKHHPQTFSERHLKQEVILLRAALDSASIKQADEMSVAFNAEIAGLQGRHKAERESASKREAELQWNLVKRNERIVEREDALVLSISLQKALQKALVERDSQIAELTKREAELHDALKNALDVMNHLGDRLNAHDLADDDKDYEVIVQKWDMVRKALKLVRSHKKDRS